MQNRTLPIRIRARRQRWALTFIAGLVLGSVPLSRAAAQPSPDGQGPGRGVPQCLPAHILEQLPTFDANRNGRLDPAEHHAMREAERKADLVAHDADGDGRLSKEEHQQLRHAKLVRHFEQLDTNRDAEISKTEAKGSCTPLEHGFDRIDSDGNGSVAWSEFEKAAQERPRNRREHPPRPRR